MTITLIGFFIVLAWGVQIIQNFLVEQRVKEQQEILNEMADYLTPYVDANDSEFLYNYVVAHAQKYKARIIIIDANAVAQVDNASVENGKKIVYNEVLNVLWNEQTMQDHSFRQAVVNKQTNDFGSKLRNVFLPKKTRYAYYVSSINSRQNNVEFEFLNAKKTPFVGRNAIMMVVSIQDVFDQISRIRFYIALIIFGVLVATIVSNYLAAKSLTNPIIELTSVIRKMSRGEMNQRVKITGKNELAQLAQSFNTMSEKIENTEKFRSEFVSNASHEMKTPLATMKILIETLQYQSEFDENLTKEFLGDIKGEIDRLNLVITDLLRLVQIDKTSQDEVQRENVKIDELAKGVIKRLTPIAHEKQILIKTEFQSVEAKIDKLKIEQVMFNLIDNAIKYSDEAKEILVFCQNDDETKEFVFKVKDSGMGIPEKDIPHIFDRFYRVDKARARQTGGTGLGLSIVEKIVKLHGGEISLESKEGEGTTFIVRIPSHNV